jgi:hypothetical protein
MTSGTTACALTANQAGNDNYTAASQATQSTTASKLAATITLDDLVKAYVSPTTLLAPKVITTPTGLSVTLTFNGTTAVGVSAVGVYNVVATINDPNYEGSAPAIFVVYDPNGGFVTGGGWINSPAGASASFPDAVGRANFGFVSKYERGAKIPSGQTQFQFKAGNLNFHSTVYEWLTVSGARAQYKGEGTINGSGKYGFLLTAVDGQINGCGNTDKFRIKIWDKNDGDKVVYNNESTSTDDSDPTTEIGGGSIVIQTR